MDLASPLPSSDRLRSIEELEGVAWAPPPLRSYVALSSFALRRKPLRDLTDEELRVGLEQHVGIGYLVPLAIERLGHDPLVEARLYQGDLLQNLLEVPFGYWQEHQDLRHETARLAATAFERSADLPASWQEEILPTLREAHDRFVGKLKSRAWLRPQRGAVPPP